MGNWTTVKEWLGLSDSYAADETDYDNYDDYDDDYGESDEAVYDRPAVRAVPAPEPRAHGQERQRPQPARSQSEWDEGDGGVRVLTQPDQSDGPRGIVRPLPVAARPVVVAPSHFNEAPEMADVFKADQPLILNLQGLDRELSRRLVDFAAGFCYVLDGRMERVNDQVFLLTPQGAVVSDDDRQRIKDGEIER